MLKVSFIFVFFMLLGLQSPGHAHEESRTSGAVAKSLETQFVSRPSPILRRPVQTEMLPKVFPLLKFEMTPLSPVLLSQNTAARMRRILSDVPSESESRERNLWIRRKQWFWFPELTLRATTRCSRFFDDTTQPKFDFYQWPHSVENSLIKESFKIASNSGTRPAVSWEQAFLILQAIINPIDSDSEAPNDPTWAATLFGLEYVMKWTPEERAAFKPALLQALNVRLLVDAYGLDWRNQLPTLEGTYSQLMGIRDDLKARAAALRDSTQKLKSDFETQFNQDLDLSPSHKVLFRQSYQQVLKDLDAALEATVRFENKEDPIAAFSQTFITTDFLRNWFQSLEDLRSREGTHPKLVSQLRESRQKLENLMTGPDSLLTWIPYYQRLSRITPPILTLIEWMLFAESQGENETPCKLLLATSAQPPTNQP